MAIITNVTFPFALSNAHQCCWRSDYQVTHRPKWPNNNNLPPQDEEPVDCPTKTTSLPFAFCCSSFSRFRQPRQTRRLIGAPPSSTKLRQAPLRPLVEPFKKLRAASCDALACDALACGPNSNTGDEENTIVLIRAIRTCSDSHTQQAGL